MTSAFGTGADWEQEFFDEMEKRWVPFFDNLRLYLTHFPGQRVTSMAVHVDVTEPLDALWAAMRQAVGATKVGETVEIRGERVTVERIGTDVPEVLVRIDGELTGFLNFAAYEPGNGASRANITGYLFADADPAVVEREQAAWTSWLESVAMAVPAS